MLNKLMASATSLAFTILSTSSFWEFEYAGSCLFFFGEPEYPSFEE